MYTDFLGTKIKVGSKIVYATSRNSSAKLTLGVVLAIGPEPNQYSPYNVRVLVQPVKNPHHADSRFKKWLYDPFTRTGEHIDVDAKVVTLHFVDKIVVLDGS